MRIKIGLQLIWKLPLSFLHCTCTYLLLIQEGKVSISSCWQTSNILERGDGGGTDFFLWGVKTSWNIKVEKIKWVCWISNQTIIKPNYQLDRWLSMTFRVSNSLLNCLFKNNLQVVSFKTMKIIKTGFDKPKQVLKDKTII